MKNTNTRSKPDYMILLIAIVMLIGYILMFDLTSVIIDGGQSDGTSILAHSHWDSYSLQAESWLEGRVDVDNLSYLELAVYNGKYYVSFPPFPSVLMLPFVAIFGGNTPNNLIIAVVCIITSLIAYKILRRTGTLELPAAFFAIFYTWGSNIMFMSMNGSVWFMAQCVNCLLLTWTVYAMLKNQRILSYALVALAVGCRPFSILMFIVLLTFYYLEDKNNPAVLKNHSGANKFSRFFIRIIYQWKAFIIPLAIAIAYMSYNYIRFDNIFEFGHNYLPEFTQSEHGQFSIFYLLPNLGNLFRPVTLTPQLHLEYSWFDGFMFFIANPILLIVIIRMIVASFKRSHSTHRYTVAALMLLNILLLCCHKTLGGWQFGARYIADLIPMALLYLILNGKSVSERHAIRHDGITNISPVYTAYMPKKYELFIAVFGLMFNVYGALKIWIGDLN